MKVNIIRLSLNHLWNSEYCMFVSKIVAIALKNNPETLHLKKAYDRLAAYMPQIAEIKAQEQSNAISNRLSDMNAERYTTIRSIMDQVKTLGKLSIPDLANYVAILNRLLDKHGRDIGSTNYTDNTKRFYDLAADYNNIAEIKTAVSGLQLTMLFDHLVGVNTRFDSLYMKRNDEKSAVETVDARAIRSETDKALTAFFDAFEVFSTEYDDLDYQTPANELNEFISHYKAQLKARTTRRHEGKDVHAETPITAM
jgi:hypothetical protein